MDSNFEALSAELLAHALSLPETYEDHPWGETVAKVNKKIFVFFGMPTNLDAELGLGLKLPHSSEGALVLPFTEPMGYGLGKAGWVSFRFPKGEDVPIELLRDWIDESYRAMAPKRLSKLLDSV